MTSRKPLYFPQTYSARRCTTKCPNCYNCKGHSKENLHNQASGSSISPMKIKEKYPFILEYQNGIYQGDLENLSKENLGIFLSDDSIFYCGSWKSDQISGLGLLFFPKGGYLYAKFEKNKINGVGMLNYPNGNRLLGYWKRSKMHGPFMHYFAQKKLWVQCEYIDGILMRYGREEFSEEIPEILREYPEMRKIVEILASDEYLKGFKLQANGEDELKFLKLTKELRYDHLEIFETPFRRYLGFTKKKSPHGLGLVFHKNSPLFYGNFKEGVLDGLGRMNLENGDIYEGIFKDGAFNGSGLYYNKKNDNFIFGSFQKNSCVSKSKVGAKYPLSQILNFKKEEHRKNVKFFNKSFSFSVLSLGPEFSDENFLEESHKTSSSSLSSLYNFPIEKATKKPLENIEVVHKSSSKDIQKTQVIEAKTHLSSQARLFNDIELFQDMIHGNYFQFPRNCLDFYDNNIDSYEVISQNNNVYNLPGNIKRILRRRKKVKQSESIIFQVETFEDMINIPPHEESDSEKKYHFLEKPSNFLEKTLRKEDVVSKTARKSSNNDKENVLEEPKDGNNEFIMIKKSGRNNFKMSQNAKSFLENDSGLNDSYENLKDVSKISSIRMAEKLENTLEKSKFLQIKKIEEELNRDELNKLSDEIYLKMSKNRGIFDVPEDLGRKFPQELLYSGQKFKGNESFGSSYSFVDKGKKERNKNQIIQVLEDELRDGEKSV